MFNFGLIVGIIIGIVIGGAGMYVYTAVTGGLPGQK